MKISFLGDVSIAKSNFFSCVDAELLTKLHASDFVICNLEGPIIGAIHSNLNPSKLYGSTLYNSGLSIIDLLVKLNVSHVSLYNNHICDYGKSQLDYTLSALESAQIKVLTPVTTFHLNDETFTIVNSGFPEYSGRFECMRHFGFNVIDFLVNPQKFPGAYIHYSHFGIEILNKLSAFEYSLLSRMTDDHNCIGIVRHHPHCIQSTLNINDSRIYCSIGDLAFLTPHRATSSGLLITFDSKDSTFQEYQISFDEHGLFIQHYIIPQFENNNWRLDQSDIEMLKARYFKDYRQRRLAIIRLLLKSFARDDRTDFLHSMSTHFLQPFLLAEVLEPQANV